MAQKKEKNMLGLEDALEEIKQRFGESAVMKLDDMKRVHIDSISTGSISLDWALGIGGVPRGRVIEIFGSESSGKTTLALHILAEAQKKGGVCAFIDAEHALDPEYAKRVGVNINDLLISQPDSGEQALEIVEALVRSKEITAPPKGTALPTIPVLAPDIVICMFFLRISVIIVATSFSFLGKNNHSALPSLIFDSSIR